LVAVQVGCGELLRGGPEMVSVDNDQQIDGRGEAVSGGIDECWQCICGEGDAIVEAFDVEGSIGGLPASAVSAFGSTRHHDLVGGVDGG
jgi:hypothetical protein